MVTTENGVRITDMELRHRIEHIIQTRGWTTNRVASEIPCSEQKLVDWLENAHVVAFTNFRGGLIRFAETYAVGSSPEQVDEAPPITQPRRAAPPAEVEWIGPASSMLARLGPGLRVAKGYTDCGISRSLLAALGKPQRIAVGLELATRTLVLTAAERPVMMPVSKAGNISKSVAKRVAAIGTRPGFYPAIDAGDGTWRIKLEA